MRVDEQGNPPAADNMESTNTDHCTCSNGYKFKWIGGFLTSLAGSYPILDKVGQGNGTVPLTAPLRFLHVLEQKEKTPNEISHRCGCYLAEWLECLTANARREFRGAGDLAVLKSQQNPSIGNTRKASSLRWLPTWLLYLWRCPSVRFPIAWIFMILTPYKSLSFWAKI
jgi:hypothetical protein